jgi:predicted protein tyrosine phosphatase
MSTVDELFAYAAIACVLQKIKQKRTRKKDTNMRRAITPNERLTATLRYLLLATGRTLQDLTFSTLISPQAMGRAAKQSTKY